MPVSDKNVPTDSSAGSIENHPSIGTPEESRGQQAFLASALLPTRGLDPKKCAELGIVIGENEQENNLFTKVQLPEGIVKEGSDHAMWSYLKDTDGNEIASIFYKAAVTIVTHSSLSGRGRCD